MSKNEIASVDEPGADENQGEAAKERGDEESIFEPLSETTPDR
jgi:hypothetical protein